MRAEAVLLAAFSVVLAAQTPSDDAKRAALGAHLSAEIAKTTTLIPDPAVRAYVSEVAAKLAGRNLLLTLQVTDSDRGGAHEPIWLPGGYIFISADLIRAARNESEFAGMMAHALAHQIRDDAPRIAETTPAGSIPFIFIESYDGAASVPRGYMARAQPFEVAADAPPPA